MKIILRPLLFLGIAFGFISATHLEFSAAGGDPQSPPPWQGTYRSVLPCADCEGLYTEISLNPNNTYKMITRYLGKKNPAYVMSGKINWSKSGDMVTLQGLKDIDRPYQYKYDGSGLTQLDMSGNRIEGQHADKYVLRKGAPAVEEKHWKLFSLYGIAVEKNKKLPKEPHIIMVADEQKITGSGGCNILSGNYALTDSTIGFTGLVTTRMACEDMDLETQLLKVLEMIDHYDISGDTLKLKKADMVPSAIFVAVYPK